MTPSSSSHTGTISSSWAIVREEKTTSEFLIRPDWTLNIDIYDTLNSNHWLAKDVVKAAKKILQNKNPKVQLPLRLWKFLFFCDIFSIVLPETMVKNCDDYVHFQIAGRNILPEMVKIVKKRTDMHVSDKILGLLDSWQEAFGGPAGKYPQYYWVYDELRHSGVGFPWGSLDCSHI